MDVCRVKVFDGVRVVGTIHVPNTLVDKAWISGIDYDHFSIVGEDLLFNNRPDIGNPADCNIDNIYEIEIRFINAFGKLVKMPYEVEIIPCVVNFTENVSISDLSGLSVNPPPLARVDHPTDY